MPTHVTKRSWTDADMARLRDLSAAGASVMRAAAALNRQTSAVKKMARIHGIALIGVREAKAVIRRLEAAH